MAVRTNYAPNPSFESSGWNSLTNAQPGGSASVSATRAWIGTSSAKLINTGTAADDCYMDTNLSGLAVGTNYTFSAYVYLETNTGNSYNNRALLAYATGITNVTQTIMPSFTTGSWTRYSLTINTGSGSTLSLRLYAPPGTCYWDGVLVEQTSTLRSYFDGSTSRSGFTCAWSGTANNSISTETSLPGLETRFFSFFR